MKKNAFKNYTKETEKDSSAFSNHYENLRYDDSPAAIYLYNKSELGIRKDD